MFCPGLKIRNSMMVAAQISHEGKREKKEKEWKRPERNKGRDVMERGRTRERKSNWERRGIYIRKTKKGLSLPPGRKKISSLAKRSCSKSRVYGAACIHFQFRTM